MRRQRLRWWQRLALAAMFIGSAAGSIAITYGIYRLLKGGLL